MTLTEVTDLECNKPEIVEAMKKILSGMRRMKRRLKIFILFKYTVPNPKIHVLQELYVSKLNDILLQRGK